MRWHPYVKKLLLLLGHRSQIRNFVSSGLAAKLPDEVTVVAPLADWIDVSADVRKSLRFCPLGNPAGTLRTRLRRHLRLGSLVARELTSVTYRHKLANEGRSQWQVALWRAIRRRHDPEAIGRRIEALVPPTRDARAILEAVRPDLVVWPTLIHTADDTEVAKAAKAAGIPVMAMPASWDGLTTKGMFSVRPDRLLVWGEASRNHAIGDHGFKPEEVEVTGPPHWDIYGHIWPRGDRVLVAGTSLHYWADERQMVEQLAREGLMVGWKIVYRPHPSRLKEDRAWVGTLASVELDSRLGYDLASGFQEHIADRVATSACVVAAFSTLIIEAALLGRPSIIPAFARSAHGPGGVLTHSLYQHMQSVVEWPGIFLCRTLPGLIGKVRQAVAGRLEYDPGELRRRALRVALADGHAQERIVQAVGRVW